MKPRIYVGMPSASGFPHPEVMLSVFNQDADAEIVFVPECLVKRKPIQNARNEIVAKFLRSRCDYLWFVDDDNPPATDVLRLLLESGKDFVSAIVPLRTAEHLNVFRNGNHVDSFDPEDGDVQPIDNCGTGCVLMSREMVKAVSEAAGGSPYRFVYEKKAMEISGNIVDYTNQELHEKDWQDRYVLENDKIKVVDSYLSEDLHFGKLAVSLGYRPYVSIYATCSHFVLEAPAKKIDRQMVYRRNKGLSIVIPTLRQGTFYDDVIKNVSELESEILSTFGSYEIVTIEGKLVNDAWNEGVEKAVGDYVMVINDDIIIRPGCFDQMKRHCDTGRIWCPYFTRKEDFSKLHTHNGNNIVGFCFGFHKNDSKFPIDPRLKIWYGDNWLYHMHGKKIGWGGRIHHFESKTLLSDEHRERINALIEKDKQLWEAVKTENGWN